MQRGTAAGPARGGSDLPLLDITERDARRPELRSLESGRREILWVCSHGVRAKHGITGLEHISCQPPHRKSKLAQVPTVARTV